MSCGIAEGGVAVPNRSHLRLTTQGSLAELDGFPDRAQQHLVTVWLGQKLHCSCLHCAHRRRHIAVARNKNDRHIYSISSDALLYVETIEARKCNVQY